MDDSDFLFDPWGHPEDGWEPSIGLPDTVPLRYLLKRRRVVRSTDKATLFCGQHPKTGDAVSFWVPLALLHGAEVWRGFIPTYLSEEGLTPITPKHCLRTPLGLLST